MKLSTWLTPITLALLGTLAAAAWADGHDRKQAPAREESTQAARPRAAEPAPMPVFVPSQSLGSPGMRQGGATRSAGPPALEPLVPERTGLTLEEQPVVYWYLSRETDAPLEFTLFDYEAAEPVFNSKLQRPERAGIQRLAFSDLGAKLKPEIEYMWTIKLLRDPENPESYSLIGGGILRVAPGAELSAALAEPGASRPHVLASGGIWYDAIDALSVAIEKNPSDDTPRQHRAHLLKAAGLPDFER